MTHKTQDLTTVGRPRLGNGRRPSTRSPLIVSDQSRHNAQHADGTRTTTDPHSSSDPRFAYLTRSFD
jgi:hypothetical protein